MGIIYQKTNPYTTPQTYHLKREDFFALTEPFTLSGNIVDAEKQEIYRGRLHIIDGHIRKIERCHVPDTCYILPGFVNAFPFEAAYPDIMEQAKTMLEHGTLAALSREPIETGFKFFYQRAKETIPCWSTDICEAEEQIEYGHKVIINEVNFLLLYPLINRYPSSVLFAINESQQVKSELFSILELLKLGIDKNLNFYNLLHAASINAINYFNLPIGKLQENDTADCIMVDSIDHPTIIQAYIDGHLLYERTND